jgi:hypothetical protein
MYFHGILVAAISLSAVRSAPTRSLVEILHAFADSESLPLDDDVSIDSISTSEFRNAPTGLFKMTYIVYGIPLTVKINGRNIDCVFGHPGVEKVIRLKAGDTIVGTTRSDEMMKSFCLKSMAWFPEGMRPDHSRWLEDSPPPDSE